MIKRSLKFGVDLFRYTPFHSLSKAASDIQTRLSIQQFALNRIRSLADAQNSKVPNSTNKSARPQAAVHSMKWRSICHIRRDSRLDAKIKTNHFFTEIGQL